MNLKYSVREIVETAMLVALAVILDLDGLKIRIGGAGGSISFTMVPLFILALRMNFSKSFIGIGVVYGLITCLKDWYGFETFPFDYLLGYGSIAIASIFKNFIYNKEKPFIGILFVIISTVLGGFLRFVFSSISSMVFYQTSFVGALVYNAAYIPFATLISTGCMLLLYKPLLIINDKFPIKDTK